jgi:hypothetical protein
MKAIQEQPFKEALQAVAPYLDALRVRMIVAREMARPQNKGLAVASYPALALASLIGHIRHNLTAYDYLLQEKHLTRYQAQQRVFDEVQQHLDKFCQPKPERQ